MDKHSIRGSDARKRSSGRNLVSSMLLVFASKKNGKVVELLLPFGQVGSSTPCVPGGRGCTILFLLLLLLLPVPVTIRSPPPFPFRLLPPSSSSPSSSHIRSVLFREILPPAWAEDRRRHVYLQLGYLWPFWRLCFPPLESKMLSAPVKLPPSLPPSPLPRIFPLCTTAIQLHEISSSPFRVRRRGSVISDP